MTTHTPHDARRRHPSSHVPLHHLHCVVCGSQCKGDRFTCSTCRKTIRLPKQFAERVITCHRCQSPPGRSCSPNDADFVHHVRLDQAYERLVNKLPKTDRPWALEVLTSKVAAALMQIDR